MAPGRREIPHAPRASSPRLPRPPRPDELSVGSPRPDEFSSERPLAFFSARASSSGPCGAPRGRRTRRLRRSLTVDSLLRKGRRKMPARTPALPVVSVLRFLSSYCIPPELPRCPGAPSRRRRPSLVKSGRCRRGGAPGPLVSSRAEAEVVFPLPSSLLRPSEDAPRPDEEPDRATKRDPNGLGFRA